MEFAGRERRGQLQRRRSTKVICALEFHLRKSCERRRIPRRKRTVTIGMPVLRSWRIPIRFTWDPRKAESNWAKQDVSFEEASTVFADPLAGIMDDEQHSEEEKREIIIVHSKRRRLLLVSFVEHTDMIRLISARKTTRMERKFYEEDDEA